MAQATPVEDIHGAEKHQRNRCVCVWRKQHQTKSYEWHKQRSRKKEGAWFLMARAIGCTWGQARGRLRRPQNLHC